MRRHTGGAIRGNHVAPSAVCNTVGYRASFAHPGADCDPFAYGDGQPASLHAEANRLAAHSYTCANPDS